MRFVPTTPSPLWTALTSLRLGWLCKVKLSDPKEVREHARPAVLCLLSTISHSLRSS